MSCCFAASPDNKGVLIVVRCSWIQCFPLLYNTDHLLNLSPHRQEYEQLRGGDPSPTMKDKWAVCVNMSINKKLVSSAANQCIGVCICFGERVAGKPDIFTPFLIAEKVRTTLRLVPCQFLGKTQQQQGANRRILIQIPLEFKSSHSVLAEFYDSVRSGNQVLVFALGLLEFGSPTSGKIAEATVGMTNRLFQLTKPSKTFCQRVAKSSDSPEDSEDPTDPTDRDDVANLGLDMLLEHIQDQREAHAGTDADADVPQSPADIDAEPDDLLLDKFCQEDAFFGGNFDDLDVTAKAYSAEIAEATGEDIAEQAERRIVNDTKTAARSMGPSVHIDESKVLQVAAGMDNILGAEAADEALLGQVCGNDSNIFITDSSPTPSSDSMAGGRHSPFVSIHFFIEMK